MRTKVKILFFFMCVLLLIGCGRENSIKIYMWGGDAKVNSYIDNIVIPHIQEKERIKVERIPIIDIKDTVNKLIIEKKANKKSGNIDIIWINGENFKILKDNDILEENLEKNIENVKLLKEDTMKLDFGVEILGREIPFGEAQFNFIYNGEGDIPFKTAQELKKYIMENPKRFVYPNVSDFVGSAFVRNIAIDILGYDNVVQMSDEEFEKKLDVVWEFFREIRPYLWKEGRFYPESEQKLDLLYSNNEINITMGYTINKVNSKINSGEFNPNSKSFLLEKGTLFNNHYLAIPKNSRNKEKSMKVINELISPQLQYEKQKYENWGDYTVLNLSRVDKEMKKEFEKLMSAENIPNEKELKGRRVMELSPEKLRIIEEGWKKEVEKI